MLACKVIFANANGTILRGFSTGLSPRGGGARFTLRLIPIIIRKEDNLMDFITKKASLKLKKINVTNPDENKAVTMRSCNCHCSCRDNYNNEFGATHGNIMYINGG